MVNPSTRGADGYISKRFKLASKFLAACNRFQNWRRILDAQKSVTQRIRIAHRWYKGRRYVDVRLVVADRAGDFVPTRQGISIRAELIAAVIHGLALAARG